MANGILEANVIGNLAKDPEIKDWNGQSFCTFPVAVNTYNKGEKEVVYIDCAIWGRIAEGFVKMARKGTSVFLSGSLKMQEYTSKTGEKRSKLTLTATKNLVLSGGSYSQGATRQSEPMATAKSIGQQNQQFNSEDDIPF